MRGSLSRHDLILFISFGIFALVLVVVVVDDHVVVRASESEEPPIHNKSEHCRLQLPE